MAINLQSIRRAYNAMYNTSGDARVKVATEYMKTIPGAIQEWAKESGKRVEAYKKNSPSLDPFKGYNQTELKNVLEWKAEWDSHAKQLAKRNLSDEERLFHTGEQNRIEQALLTYKEETEAYTALRKQVVENYSNKHPSMTDEESILWDQIYRNEFRNDRTVDLRTGKSTWGTQVSGDDQSGYITNYAINDIYEYQQGMPVLSATDKNYQTKMEQAVFNRVKALATDKSVKSSLARVEITSLYNSLFNERNIWAGDHIDTWVGKINADIDSNFEEFEKSALGEKLKNVDLEDFNNLKQLDSKSREATVKNLLKRAGKNIKEEWVDFNTMVSMSVYDAKRGEGASYKDPFNPNN
jgi:hypothetical protein